MNQNLIVLALLMSLTQAGHAALPVVTKSVAVRATEAKLEINKNEIENLVNKGKTAKEKRDLLIQEYGDNAAIQAAAETIQMSKTELLSHLATNLDAVETVNYTVRILKDVKASELDTRAALSNSKILRTIARNSALTAKDQADIAATRKMVVLGAYVAGYGKKAVMWHENVAKKTSEGLQANIAVRVAAKEILNLEGQALEDFMSRDNKDSLANCKL